MNNIPLPKYIDIKRLAQAFNIYFELGLNIIDISIENECENTDLIGSIGLHYIKTGRIVINDVLLYMPIKRLLDTTLHELIHRFLCVNKRGHGDKDPEFIQFSKDLGFSHNLLKIPMTVDYSTISDIWIIYHELLTWQKPTGENILNIRENYNFYLTFSTHIIKHWRKVHTNIVCPITIMFLSCHPINHRGDG